MNNEGWSWGDLMGELMARGIDPDEVSDGDLSGVLDCRPETAAEMIDPSRSGKLLHVSHGMMRLPSGKMSSRTGDVITGEVFLRFVSATHSRSCQKVSRHHEQFTAIGFHQHVSFVQKTSVVIV